jgi:hypothetical protein
MSTLLAASAARADGVSAPPLALTISGAVSLGAYEAGFLHYLLEALRANPGAREVRLITGASAGSANGLLAIMQHCGLAPPRTSEGLFWRSWIPLGLDRFRKGGPASPLAAFSRGALREQAMPIEEAWKAGLRESCDVVLGMSATRVEPRTFTLGSGGLRLPRIDEQFAVRVQGRGPGRPPRLTNYVDPAWSGDQLLLPEDEAGEVAFSDLRDLLFASTAFPLAFEPQPLAHCVARASPGSVPRCPRALAQSSPFLDGGLLDNWPLRFAMRLARAGMRDGRGAGGYWLDEPRLGSGDLPARALFAYLSTNVIGYPVEEPPRPPPDRPEMLDYVPRLVVDFFDAAMARNLLSFVEDEPSIGDRVVVPARSLPAAGSPLMAFFGFFEEDFRQFDFILGMYEARRMLAEADGVWRWPARSLPEEVVAGDPAWQPLGCMRAMLERSGSAGEACRGEELRNFRILLQTSMERLWDRCARPDAAVPAHHALCQAAHAGDPPPLIPGVDGLGERWRRQPEEGQVGYVMRLLVAHRFGFRDHGLPDTRTKEAPAVFRRELIAIGRKVARLQPVADALVLETLVGLIADGLVYVPPRSTLWLTAGRDLELGWSLGFFDAFEEGRWLRLHLAGQFNGWSQLLSSDPSVNSVTLLGGAELMPPRVSSTRFQFGLLARAGMLLTNRDRLGTRSCPTPDSTIGHCTRLTVQAGLSGVVLEHFRLHLVVPWYPRWKPGARALWSVAPAAGVQLTF